MTNITRGFSGRVLSVVEAVEGTTPDNPDFIKFSDYVQSVELSTDTNFNDYRDIGAPEVAGFFDGLHEYRLKITYLLHENRTEQLFDALERRSDGDLEPRTIEAAVGRDGASPGFYTFRGMKPADVDVKNEVGKPVEVSITYQGSGSAPVGAEPAVGTGSRESAALGDVCEFRTSAITRDGVAIAYVTRSMSVTVNHNLEIEGTDGQNGPRVITPGAFDVKATVDISVDDGGVALAAATMDGDVADFAMNMGGVGAPRLVLTAGRYENFEIPMNVSDGFIKRAVPVRAKGITATVVA